MFSLTTAANSLLQFQSHKYFYSCKDLYWSLNMRNVQAAIARDYYFPQRAGISSQSCKASNFANNLIPCMCICLLLSLCSCNHQGVLLLVSSATAKLLSIAIKESTKVIHPVAGTCFCFIKAVSPGILYPSGCTLQDGLLGIPLLQEEAQV